MVLIKSQSEIDTKVCLPLCGLVDFLGRLIVTPINPVKLNKESVASRWFKVSLDPRERKALSLPDYSTLLYNKAKPLVNTPVE